MRSLDVSPASTLLLIAKEIDVGGELTGTVIGACVGVRVGDKVGGLVVGATVGLGDGIIVVGSRVVGERE